MVAKQTKTKEKNVLKRAPQLRSPVNRTNILKTQYSNNKASMADINKTQAAKNHYRGKTHISNIIFSNMKILHHKP
jgi:hypothetical protein